ncbi:MAG: DUF2851 family protein [Nibricoccus sp.]
MMKTPGGGGEGMAVAEIQGLYGAFSFPEKLLQQIWLRGDFDTRDLCTADGRSLEVLHPGRWNLLGGPDFTGARLRIDGVVTTGDVELHLHAADWRAHGHAADPAYAKVILHVVLFPGGDQMTAGFGGQALPLLALLPLLHHDLEEYAADAAVERLANHPLTRAHETLAALSEEALRAELNRHARERWSQKVRYAKIRIDRLGWAEACHHTALEILGYRANRAAMLAVAAVHPLEAWSKLTAAAERDAFVAEIMAQSGVLWRWRAQGVRPANHPRTRFLQYAEWAGTCPDWPGRLIAFSEKLPDGIEKGGRPVTTADLRKLGGFRVLKSRFADEVSGGVIGGSRFNTLICDGFLPLLAARDPAQLDALGIWWTNWFPGDAPAKWLVLLRGLGVIGSREWPASHGALQGLLGWLIAEEKKQNSGDSVEGRGT